MSEIVLKCKDTRAVINYHGAELKSLSKNGKEYLWNSDPAYWNRSSPVLFPFVGAVNNKTFCYKGVKYPMGQHGFARDMDFELIGSDETSCCFLLKSDEETRKLYPMDFKLKIGYELSENGLMVLWSVENPGNEDLEFSIGAHPAFLCTLDETSIAIRKNGKGLNQFTNSVFGTGLLTDKKAIIKLSDEGVMKLDAHSFDGDAFVIEDNQSDEVEILDDNGNGFLAVKFSSPLVGIWSPPGKNAPFLCIEPWYGRADKEGFVGELKDREWNNTLPAGEEFNTYYEILLR